MLCSSTAKMEGCLNAALFFAVVSKNKLSARGFLSDVADCYTVGYIVASTGLLMSHQFPNQTL